MASNNLDEKLNELTENTKKNLEYAQSILGAIPADQEKTYSQLKKLLQDNLEYSKSIYLLVKKIQRWLLWQRIFSVLKWLMILIPIILGIIYLPVLSDWVAEIQENLNIIKQNQSAVEQFSNQLK